MPTTPRKLVETFYHDVWNNADEKIAWEILDKDFRFRASLGPERRGPSGFIDYMRSIHAALGDYICIIEDLITVDDRVAAKMTFKGNHQGEFFGVPATGKTVSWAGAAFFKISEGQIAELWVLGDIDSIKQQLGISASENFSTN